MSPTAMLTLMVAAFAMFAWSASRRWRLAQIGRPPPDGGRLDYLTTRLAGTWTYAFRQEKMDYYSPAGIAHKFIFAGFVVLLFRTLVLWGRGFYPPFNLWVLSPNQPIGQVYEFTKDCMAMLVCLGTLVFFYYRLVAKPKRMALSVEGVLILVIIFTMMVADMTYDGASLALEAKKGPFCAWNGHTGSPELCAIIGAITAPLDGEQLRGGWSAWPAPAGSFFASLFAKSSPAALVWFARAGFWTHSTLVLVFLNLLPHSKHFHVITAIPNVFLRSLTPAGRLQPMAESAEKLMEKVGAASEAADPLALPIGVARIEHFTWKSILDFYTCTECGRCSDNCPAHRTGKVLSPKHFTLALRDHLYGREDELVHRGPKPSADGTASNGAEGAPAPAEPDRTAENGVENGTIEAIDLVPNVILPDVLWACTTCRACEEQCPVLISYVDKIVDMRRNLVMVKGEFPQQLARPFQGMEANGNPWNLSRMDRAGWADGLGVATMSDRPDAPVLFWVGCAASYDDRAKRIARATAKLLQRAKVDFAILGLEESCTGDPARRAGNEFLFAMLAEGNAGTINGYISQGKGGARTVVTTCPHCFNTLKNEYPDFGLHVEVVHHSDYLLGLVAEKRLVPQKPLQARVVYHDSCYLGRYNGIYDPPREILRRIPGVELVEPEYWTKQRGLCCGAGGAQMWMEEQNQDRVNVKRTLQLLDTGATTIASGCPFCMTMLTDGIKSKSLEEAIEQLDVAELLDRSCDVPEEMPAPPAEPPAPAPSPEQGAVAL
ncbi:MAG TPA: (Fe-S)-binding protein [Polyangiaceae bacterium]|jgi:Fe-S oxidoreductase|nr:(Fe-S)-binding protein [Polyangiaceae bacterium]